MAITQNPLIGATSGTFAGSVFSRSFGKNIIRSKPVTVSNPNTDAQALVREKFSKAAAAVKLLLAFFKAAFANDNLGKSVFSYLVGKAYDNALSGTLGATVVDFEKIAPTPDSLRLADEITIDQSVADEVTITWDETAILAKNPNVTGLIFGVIDADLEIAANHITPVALATETVTISLDGTSSSNEVVVYVMPKGTTTPKFKAGSELAEKV